MMNAPPLILLFTTLPLSSFNKKRHQMSVQCHMYTLYTLYTVQMSVQCHMRFKFRNTLEYLYLYFVHLPGDASLHLTHILLDLES